MQLPKVVNGAADAAVRSGLLESAIQQKAAEQGRQVGLLTLGRIYSCKCREHPYVSRQPT